MDTLERERGVKKAFSSELFDSIIAESKKGLENGQFKEKKSKSVKNKEIKVAAKVETFP